MQNAPEHSAILSTFMKLPFVFKTFVLFILEWLLKTGFTVLAFGFACISMQEELSLMPIFKQKMSQNFPINLSAEGVLTVTVKGFPASTTGKLMIYNDWI